MGVGIVGVGFAMVVTMVFAVTRHNPGPAPCFARAAMTSKGYLGFIAGPPAISFGAKLIDLRAASSFIVAAMLTLAS